METDRTKNKLVTKGFLDERFDAFEKKITRVIDLKIDEKFDILTKTINQTLSKDRDTFYKLADKIIGVHKKFEVESSSIKHNYNRLENRVDKLEKFTKIPLGAA